MKTTFISIILLLVMDTGCTKSNLLSSLLEITPESETEMIQIDTNGIGFEFCLLNEAGLPSTVFNGGDNIIFSFTIKNNTQDTINVTTEFINSNFFRIFSSENNIDLGKPWTGIWCQYSLSPQNINLPPSYLKQITCPWILTENNLPVYPLCMGESKNPLSKGEYYTYIDLDFHYSINSNKVTINNLKLKINFKIL